MKSAKIFSLNSGGIPFSPNRKIRFRMLPEFLKKERFDFVLLQEIGDKFTYDNLKKSLGDVYSFYPEQSPGLINTQGGLLLLSLKPLKRYRFIKYKIKSGPRFPYNLPEKLSNKGIQICETEIGSTKVVFIHTHLLANFFGSEKEYEYLDKQLSELIEFIQKIPNGTKLILSGDLNFPPETGLYKRLIKMTGLTDPLTGKSVYTHSFKNLNIHKLFVKWGLMWGNKREDYTLYKGFHKNAVRQTVYEKKFRNNGKLYDLSDHYGILTTISVV
jgi:endonuclease/exonuclease/phosphatase family metal-dependent hydrolase